MQPHRGDLFEMLYPASSRTEDGPALAHARSFSYADDFHAADDQRIRTSSAASGTLLMFRDSFGSSLVPLLAEGYARITLVDIRYVAPERLGMWLTFDNQDVLFLYSTPVLNNSETLK